VILAGREGFRLRPLTRSISGDDRPKQFCAVVGTGTLLSDTQRRAALIAPANRALIVVTKRHECFYRPLLGDMRKSAVVVQPENRGTAPAVLYALLRIAKSAPEDLVAFLPSDHFVSDDEAFMAHVERAFGACRQQPGLVILLGIKATNAELGYDWIEPGEPVAGVDLPDLRRVRRFWEKPLPALAVEFQAQAWLWNSFVMVGRASTILDLIKQAVPSVHDSRRVLSAVSADLAVLPVRDVYWNDLGDPDRVIATWRHLLKDATTTNERKGANYHETTVE